MSLAASRSADLDAAVETAAAHKDAWSRLPIEARIDLARQCIDGMQREADAMVLASCQAKGLDPRSSASAEEWMAGPLPVVRNLRLLVESLRGIARSGHPPLRPGAVHRLPTGGLAVNVFPHDPFEPVLYRGIRIDVWMQPDVTEATLPDTMAVAYRTSGVPAAGRVALVLGAGNVASIGAMDVLFKLFVENAVVVLKMHPVNDYLGPIVERAFRPLVEHGFLQIVYGDANEGSYLVHHSGIDEIHMTGSGAVHDRIVWGDTPDEQRRRRASGTPKVRKRVTSELGCVTPVVVIPGEWSQAEIAFQAEHVATMVAHNGSCNCNAAKLLITSRRWPARRPFLDELSRVLSTLPPRAPFYPGAAARYEAFRRGHAQCRCLGSPSDSALPFATIFDVDPDRADDPVFTEEAWSPIVAETVLDAADEAEFADAAVRFCNERVEGTLSAVVLVDPRVRRRIGARFDRALADLRYGTIAVNEWSALNYALAVAPWGAYPGHTLDRIGSGSGVVHNALMFDRPLKSVLAGPFTAGPKPVWFATHRRADVVGRRMVAFEASPSWSRLPGIIWPALRA